MLEFPRYLIPDSPELNSIAEKQITDTIAEYIKNIIRHACETEGIPFNEDVLTADLRHCDFLDGMVLPACYTRKEKIATLAALYSLLIGDEKNIPTLEMEYAMADAIENMIAAEADGACVYTKKFPAKIRKQMTDIIMPDMQRFTKDYMMLSDEFAEMLGIEGISLGNAAEIMTEMHISSIETPNEEWITNYCFADASFSLLDMIDIERLRKTRTNRYMNILPEDEEDEQYYLPDDWLTSRDFSFF